MATELDLGDGLLTFRCGERRFSVDLVEWVHWWQRFQEDPDNLVSLAREKLKAEAGVCLNETQADAFLHALTRAYSDLKKKQADELTSASSSASTPSD